MFTYQIENNRKIWHLLCVLNAIYENIPSATSFCLEKCAFLEKYWTKKFVIKIITKIMNSSTTH